jgi:hypothetical protein
VITPHSKEINMSSTIVNAGRWTEHRLPANERKPILFEFYVTGSRDFPFDMLRYDRCFPATGEDAYKLDHESRDLRTVKLLSYNEPTPDRWMSFGWSMSRTDPKF